MPQNSPKMIIKSTKKYMKYVSFILGLLISIIGITLTVTANFTTESFIDYQMQLRPGSEIIEIWSKPDVNVTLDLYFFNWTNSEEFYDLQKKPKFQEVGPYSYIEVPIKKIFKWHAENNTMDYGKKHLYYPNEERMNGSLSDNLVSINALLVGAASKSRHWPYFTRLAIDSVLRIYENRIAWKKTADEFIFKGFKDDILDLLSLLPSSFLNTLDLAIPWDKIGYSSERNNSVDFLGIHTIHTGIGDMSKYGQLVQWKGKNYTNAFAKGCNAIDGSPGEFQKTHLKKHESIKYFFTDFCRAAEMDYVDEVMVEGVRGFRYKLSHKAFDNGTFYPENECYCNGECLPYGVFNISSCWFGLPIMVSKPHFMDADPSFAEQVEGMEPNRTMHESFVILEPRTGYMLDIYASLQIDVYVRPTSHIKAFPNKRRVLFPVAWFVMKAHVSKYGASILRLCLNMSLYMQIFGVFVTIVGLILMLWHPCKQRWNKRYVHHMEINNIGDDDDDDNAIDESKNISAKDNLFGLPANFPSLMYITHTRHSLPVIISHLDDDDDEALRSCLDSEQPQEFELTSEECDSSLDFNS